jgi:hypothetical protein
MRQYLCLRDPGDADAIGKGPRLASKALGDVLRRGSGGIAEPVDIREVPAEIR